MKKMNLLKTSLLAATVFSAVNVFAQYDVGADVDTELNQVYQTQQAPRGGSYAPKGGQPIYIMNNQQQPNSQMAVQKQPTTVIEASPLTESNAEKIRRARQDAELQTEQKIVEKLETSRMEDEKRRANILFGDKFNTLNGEQQQPQQPVQPVVAQEPAVAPTPVVIQQAPQENTRDVVREEIKAALDSEKTIQDKPASNKYVGVGLGMGDIPEAKNVKGNYALGLMIGSRNENGLVVEGGFTYSTYEIERQYVDANGVLFPRFIDATQYAGSLAAKFELSQSTFRPFIGGLAQFSYREYTFSSNQYYSDAPDQDARATSTALDLGLTAGMDLAVTEHMALGLDFKYMFNLTNQSETKRSVYYDNQQIYGTKLEKLNYYVVGLTAKYLF